MEIINLLTGLVVALVALLSAYGVIRSTRADRDIIAKDLAIIEQLKSNEMPYAALAKRVQDRLDRLCVAEESRDGRPGRSPLILAFASVAFPLVLGVGLMAASESARLQSLGATLAGLFIVMILALTVGALLGVVTAWWRMRRVTG